ncbi:MAG: hypothetical protein COW85_11180 [Ignavibacteria bacterium CG22_combo_CG10-13_8_21_14_all_37_15]|nr:MAG: hypothetical protein COW85_11180 [Ignavibacteria bacterium CG22_combo_CG10-13_8_21_14_all_37_15]
MHLKKLLTLWVIKMDKKIFDIYDEHFPGEENVPDKFAGPVEDQEKLDDLRKSADVLKSLSSVSIDEKYFTNILPRFRENLEKKQRSFFYKKLIYSSSIAFSTLLLLVFSFQFVNTNFQSKVTQQNETMETVLPTASQDIYIASADQFSDSIVNDSAVKQEIDKTLNQSLSAASNSNDYILIKNTMDYNNVLSQLDDDELEKVYAQLQQTKIL